MTQPLKWHGGKSYLAKWIINNFPNRDSYTHYCEPYFGGGSVLFCHDPTDKAECVNDIHKELMQFWITLAHHPDELIRKLRCTPLSQEMWSGAGNDPVEFFIRYRQSRQGLGKSYCTPTTRLRRGMNENVSAWLTAVDGLPEAHERLRRVELRNLDAIAFIRQYDHKQALFYCDPPYLHDTRIAKDSYDYEMTTLDHKKLLQCLRTIQGKFILSGYHSPLYDEVAKKNNWRIAEKQIDNKASSQATKEIKTEVLWMNYPL